VRSAPAAERSLDSRSDYREAEEGERHLPEQRIEVKMMGGVLAEKDEPGERGERGEGEADEQRDVSRPGVSPAAAQRESEKQQRSEAEEHE